MRRRRDGQPGRGAANMATAPSVPTDPNTLKEEHERREKVFRGYMAFVAALLIATIARSADYPYVWVIIGLLAVSLPSLVTLDLLGFIVSVRQARRKSAFRGLAVGLGFGPSILGIAALIWHFSVISQRRVRAPSPVLVPRHRYGRLPRL